jgi:cell division protein ZapA (FtsZ GTPase activity inhibitor)
LTVRTERSEEHMARLAETLNGRVREIQKQGSTANYLNIVMLAAMELADEVLMFDERFREVKEQVEALRREREDLKTRLDRKSRDLLATLDDALK